MMVRNIRISQSPCRILLLCSQPGGRGIDNLLPAPPIWEANQAPRTVAHADHCTVPANLARALYQAVVAFQNSPRIVNHNFVHR
jgi:hypothetical protein